MTSFHDDAGASSRAERGSPHRHFVDQDGVHWRVFEHQPPFDRRMRSSLIFESTHILRRVRTFPVDWHELPDDELSRLSRAR